MTTEQPDAMNQVRHAVASAPADGLLERLAELVSARAGVQAVFGEPIRQDHLTVIPVARVRWGFGGGGGRSDGRPVGPPRVPAAVVARPPTPSATSRSAQTVRRSGQSASRSRARCS